jgi:hypothetical protein
MRNCKAVRLPGLAKSAVTVALILFFSVAVSAQERVGVRPSPKAGEKIQVTARQEVVLRLGLKPDEPGPDFMRSNNTVTYTQINRTVDAEGKLEAMIVLESLQVEESFGGSPRKGPDTSSIKGRILTVTFDREGKLTAIKVPPEMRDVSSRLTQLLAGAYGIVNFVPAVELAIGEETIHTTELPMRLPGNVSQGPLQAKTTLKMRALDKQGKSRIARLQQDVNIDTSTSTIQMTGGGTIDVNLDRGFVSATDTEWKITGTMPMKDATQGPPFVGSIKISVSAN